MNSTAARPPIVDVLRRGLRKRCPQCGEGRLFQRTIVIHHRCSACGLLYQRDYGDTLMFMFITDRIPVLLGVAALYFGFRSGSWPVATAFFMALVLPIVATIRERQGLALALDYLSRVYLPDPSDEIHIHARKEAYEVVQPVSDPFRSGVGVPEERDRREACRAGD